MPLLCRSKPYSKAILFQRLAMELPRSATLISYIYWLTIAGAQKWYGFLPLVANWSREILQQFTDGSRQG